MDVLTVGAVMTKDVFTVSPDTEFKDIATLLTREKISAVPVVDRHGSPVGVVSEADLLHKEECVGDGAPPRIAGRRGRQRWRKAAARCARDLMTSSVLTVDIEVPVPAAARTLAVSGVRRLFVLAEGKLVGVVSRRDLLGVFLRPDDEVRAEIEDEVFRRVLRTEPGNHSVTVDNGVVTLLGLLDRKSAVAGAGQLTELVPGVLEVRNRMDYVWNDERA